MGGTDARYKRGKHDPAGLFILHQDRDIIVVDKAPGVLTMGTESEKTRTAYYRLTDYVRKGNPKSREQIFVVHRLDREASGIVVFARSERAKFALQSQWDEAEKHYLVLVHGVPDEPQGEFRSYLVEGASHKVYSTTDSRLGRLSRTAYKVLQTSQDVSVLDIVLLTGCKHQIRVHLSENGLPIVGDRTYGRARAGERRLALHAKSIAFRHPHTNEPCFFETRMPFMFSRVSA